MSSGNFYRGGLVNDYNRMEESSDSDMTAFTPKPNRTRPPLKSSNLVDSPNNNNNHNHNFNNTNGMSRAELEEAYRRLDTPKTTYTRQSEQSHNRNNDSFTGKELRMKLQNIIDSEANDTEEENSLMLSPATLKILGRSDSMNQSKSNLNSGLSSSRKPVKFMKEDDDVLDADYAHDHDHDYDYDDDDGDTADLIAEYTRQPSQSMPYQAPQYQQYHHQTQVNGIYSPSKLPTSSSAPSPYVYDGNSKSKSNTNDNNLTPSKNLRDELDQSRTRFRQSINELLNSSPIQTTKTGSPLSEMIKEGSKLSNQVMHDLEIIEKEAKSSLLSLESKDPLRKLRPDEIIALAQNDAQSNVANSRQSTSKQPNHEEELPRKSIAWTLFWRMLWACFIVFILLSMDMLVQGMMARQSMGLSLIPDEWWYPLEAFKEYLMDKFPQLMPSPLMGPY